INSLLDDGLTIIVQANAARFVGAGTFETTSLNFECGIPTVRTLIDPFADRKSIESWLDLLGPIPPVGEDATWHSVVGQNVRGLRHDDNFHRIDHRHDPRHAVGMHWPVVSSPCPPAA